MQEQRGAERLATEQYAVTAGHGQSLQDRSRMTLPNNGGETPTACHTASAEDAQRRGQSSRERWKVLSARAVSLSRERAEKYPPCRNIRSFREGVTIFNVSISDRW